MEKLLINKTMLKFKKLIFISAIILFIFSVGNFLKAESQKLYISNNNIYYDCPDKAISAPDELNIDIGSVKIIDDRFFKDDNNVYVAVADAHSHVCSFHKITDANPDTFIVFNNFFQKDKNNAYKSDYYWGWLVPSKINGADASSFNILSDIYALDNNRAYYASNIGLNIANNIDSDTFEILTEDKNYSMDKNNIYYQGKILGNNEISITNNSLYNNLKGKILLKVEENGEAYYIHPSAKKMYFLSRPIIAFKVMREQGVGITNNDLKKIPVADGYCPTYLSNCDEPNIHNLAFTNAQKGKIFLQIEKNGEAWYINPENNKRYFLGRPIDAFNIMKNLGLGISNNNFNDLQ
jgi:hypothetical protein